MAESTIAVVAQKLRTWNRTIGGNSVEEESTFPGEYPLASYSVLSAAVSTATANSHMLQVMAGGTLNVRIRRVTITQGAAPAAVTGLEIDIFRLTTAGTGGTAITARPYDSGDVAAGATGMTLPTVKGTEGTLLRQAGTYFGTTAILPSRPLWEWTQLPNTKPIIIPAGTSNGIAIKNTGALATATCYIEVEIVETTFL